jgi:hypothetical protein
MTTPEDIEKAIEQLDPRELARFRAWFEVFDADRFDAAIENDAHAGKLDAFAEEALAAHRAGGVPGTCETLRFAHASASFFSTALKRMLRLPARAVASATAPSSV